MEIGQTIIHNKAGMMSSEEEKHFVHALKRAVSRGDATTTRRLIKGGVDVNNSSFWVMSNIASYSTSDLMAYYGR